ncbi:hypothetical protein [Candidatus Accumulibacter aalborgensis]|nr:hypothetical protein [Candidatus Accumulibacter aalborgensis]
MELFIGQRWREVLAVPHQPRVRVGLPEVVKVDVAQQPKQGVGVWQGIDLREQQVETLPSRRRGLAMNWGRDISRLVSRRGEG